MDNAQEQNFEIKHLKAFRKKFIDSYATLLLNYIINPPRDSKGVKNFRSILQIFGTGLEEVPFVGPLLQMIPQSASMGIHNFDKNRQKYKIEQLISKIVKTDNGNLISTEKEFTISAIKLHLEDAAFEISRVFEYQITSRQNPNDVLIMAEDAAIRSFQYLKDETNTKFDRNDIVKGVLEGLSDHENKPAIISVGDHVAKNIGKDISGDSWFTPTVFKQAGVMCGEELGARKYYQVGNGNYQKYGFRRKYLNWYPNTETPGDNSASSTSNMAIIFQPEELNKNITKNDVSNDVSQVKKFNKYMPYYIRVKEDDLTEYLNIVKNAKPSKFQSFNNFIGRRYFKEDFRQNQKVSAIITELPKDMHKTLSYGDFSNTVWIHMNLSGYDLSHCNFDHACLMYTNLSETTIINTTFNGADLRNANLRKIKKSNKTIFKNAKLSRANLSCSKFEYACFENVEMFSTDVTQADFSDANMTNVKADGTDFSYAINSETLYEKYNRLKESSDKTLKKLKKLKMLDKIYEQNNELIYEITHMRRELKKLNEQYESLYSLLHQMALYVNDTPDKLNFILYCEDMKRKNMKNHEYQQTRIISGEIDDEEENEKSESEEASEQGHRPSSSKKL